MASLKYLLIVILLLWSNVVSSHPDGVKPYWYPSTYIYGFVQGCWETVEQNQFQTDMWPDDIRAVCGCVIDSIRHVMPFHEVESKDPESIAKFDRITRGVLPQCIMEQEARILMEDKLQNEKL